MTYMEVGYASSCGPNNSHLGSMGIEDELP